MLLRTVCLLMLPDTPLRGSTQEVLSTQRTTRAFVTHRVFENKMATLCQEKMAQSIPLLVYSLLKLKRKPNPNERTLKLTYQVNGAVYVH